MKKLLQHLLSSRATGYPWFTWKVAVKVVYVCVSVCGQLANILSCSTVISFRSQTVICEGQAIAADKQSCNFSKWCTFCYKSWFPSLIFLL